MSSWLTKTVPTVNDDILVRGEAKGTPSYVSSARLILHYKFKADMTTSHSLMMSGGCMKVSWLLPDDSMG